MNRWLRRFGLAVIVTGSFWVISADRAGQGEVAGLRGFAPARVEEERALEQKLLDIPDAAHSESNLRRLTSEPHMAGSEASHRTALWLRDQYRSFGFDTEIVTYNAWMSMPREVELELIAPERKTLASPEQEFKGDPEPYHKRTRIAFNAYSASGDVTAQVVYVNYGMQEDYRELTELGESAEGKIVIARYGHGYRGIKAKLAEEHKAVGLIIYSDPGDDGYAQGDVYPQGPWRPMSGIQRGSVLYTEIHPGDPLTAGPSGKRVSPAEATNITHIPTLPINATDASAILQKLAGSSVPHNWQGGLPFAYHAGSNNVKAHIKVEMDYAERPIYNVIAKLHGSSDDQWVLLGNHHDAWVFGAADPGSGTAAMLETGRSLGALAKTGWKPKRTIVICEWDAEEPGLLGSTAWVEANLAELREKAVAYINTDVGVTGPKFSAAATPSLKEFIRDATQRVQDPATGRSVYDSWRDHVANVDSGASSAARQFPRAETPGEPRVGDLGAGSDFCPFFDYAGIPSLDVGFEGDYGVYHSALDDFYWMKHFGDPAFTYHQALARVLGLMAVRLDEADVLPFDYSAYGKEMARASARVAARSAQLLGDEPSAELVTQATGEFMDAATREEQTLTGNSWQSLPVSETTEINREMVQVEEALLDPAGLAGRPWFKHTIYAPGSYAGYAAEVMPGVNEALDRNDRAAVRQEARAVGTALHRAAERLDDISRRANGTPPGSEFDSGH